jgi:acetyl esterase/lipase
MMLFIRLGLDSEKIALQGFSAGAHLALLAAATGDKPGFDDPSSRPAGSAAVQAEIGLFLNRAVVDPEFYRQENLALNPFARQGGPGGPPHGG